MILTRMKEELCVSARYRGTLHLIDRDCMATYKRAAPVIPFVVIALQMTCNVSRFATQNSQQSVDIGAIYVYQCPWLTFLLARNQVWM